MITIGNIKGVSKNHQITVFRAGDNSFYLQVILTHKDGKKKIDNIYF